MCLGAAFPEQTEQGSCHRQLEQGSQRIQMMEKLKETLKLVVGLPKFCRLTCLGMEEAAVPPSRAWADEPGCCAAVPLQLC